MELYRKIIIKSEADLPKGKGEYYAYSKSKKMSIWGYDCGNIDVMPTEKEVPLTAEEISLKDKILEEAKKGNIVVSTFDGLMICPLKDVVEQPTEGLLYDINRDQATILTLINDPKWVNDYACMQVIYELKSRLKMPQFQPKEIVLPNDEEIEKETHSRLMHKRFESNTGYLNVDKAYAFIKGAKWLRDLIQNQMLKNVKKC